MRAGCAVRGAWPSHSALALSLAVALLLCADGFSTATVAAKGAKFTAADLPALESHAVRAAQDGDARRAAALFSQCLELTPDRPVRLLYNLGMAAQAAGERQRAAAAFTEITKVVSTKLRSEEEQRLQRESHLKLAAILRDAGQPDLVVAHLREAIAMDPSKPNAYMYLGDTLNNLKRWSEALNLYDQALGLSEHPSVDVLNRMGDTALNAKQYAFAVEKYRMAFELEPHNAEVLNGLLFASAETSSWKHWAALHDRLERATQLALVRGEPSPVPPYNTLFFLFEEDFAKEIAASWTYRTVLSAQRAAVGQKSGLLSRPREFFVQQMGEHLRAAGRSSETDEATKATSDFGLCGNVAPAGTVPPIRIGYISRRFERYPGTQLMLRLFGEHRRGRVCVFAYAHGPEDGSVERFTVRRDVDVFRDVSHHPPVAVAERIRADGVHVLIDYDGAHGFNNLDVLALRPAPVQATWLGFARTSGQASLGTTPPFHTRSVQQLLGSVHGQAVDFALIDQHVATPETISQSFAERTLFLPWSYQPQDECQGHNASHSANGHLLCCLSPQGSCCTRADAFPSAIVPFVDKLAMLQKEFNLSVGVPTQIEDLSASGSVFVYGCLNRNSKISPSVFADWMMILRRVPSGLLLLYRGSDLAVRNLQAAAKAAGVQPARLLFAGRVSKPIFLERLHTAVDLLLDTSPYGTHSIAADAFWGGTPMLTLPGDSFASRVGASLLHSVDTARASVLPKVLVANSNKDYVDIAVSLARSTPASAPRAAATGQSVTDGEDPPCAVPTNVGGHPPAGIGLPGEEHHARRPIDSVRLRLGNARGNFLFNSTRFSAALERAAHAMIDLELSVGGENAQRLVL